MINNIKEIYSEARQRVGKDIVVLLITDTETYLILDSGLKILPYGSKSITTDYFKHTPPTESEIEAAITIVEDEIMPLVAGIRSLNLQLVSPDNGIMEIMSHTMQSGDTMSVANVERIFSRLAAIITGRPASMDTLPDDNDFVSRVLILREVMHHLHFSNILTYQSEIG